MVYVRSMLLFVLVSSSGCSLVFSGSGYEGGGADAGVDAGAADAGVDAGATDAGTARVVCASHRACLNTMIETDYVCVPRGPGGEFICAERCEAPMDCGPFRGGPGHDEGRICRTDGRCGCASSLDCLDPAFRSCDRISGTCEDADCEFNSNCPPGFFCFGERCQRWMCDQPADCGDDRMPAACIAGPLGGGTFCSDECVAQAECSTGVCNIPMRRCGI